MGQSAELLWSNVLKAYEKKNKDSSVFETWLKPTRGKSIDADALIVSVPNSLFAEMIQNRYSKELRSILSGVLKTDMEIKFLPEEAPNERIPPLPNENNDSEKLSPAEKILTSELTEPKIKSNLNPKYTFDTFVIGPSNQFACAAAKASSENIGNVYNPLFIYGGVGLGKTHILHAVGHEVIKKKENARVHYLSSESFLNEMIFAIQHGKTYEFRRKYRSIDVLLIDDIQFLQGKSGVQEEFFHTFNTLYDAHKQIIMTSDRPPKDIKGVEERLVSRFGWGLIADVLAPDYETRMAILWKKIEDEKISIEKEVVDYIATHITSNIRELEGAITRLVAEASLKNVEIDLELAKIVLRDIIAPMPEITVERIIEIVANNFGMTPAKMLSASRKSEIVRPRQIAMYLCKELTKSTLQDIGASFGGKDHTTVINAINKINKLLDKDDNKTVKNLVEIKKKLKND